MMSAGMEVSAHPIKIGPTRMRTPKRKNPALVTKPPFPGKGSEPNIPMLKPKKAMNVKTAIFKVPIFRASISGYIMNIAGRRKSAKPIFMDSAQSGKKEAPEILEATTAAIATGGVMADRTEK